MNSRTANTVAMVLTTVGILFMLIMAFGVFGIPRMVALFFGVASFIVAGLVKRLGNSAA